MDESSSVNISGAIAPPMTPANVYARELPVERKRGENCSTMKAACGPYINEWVMSSQDNADNQHGLVLTSKDDEEHERPDRRK